MTAEYVCSEQCGDPVGFIHTQSGLVCEGCLAPAAVMSTNCGQIVPFGITRQLEELDRMVSL